MADQVADAADTLAAELAALTARLVTLAGAELHLYQSTFVPDENSLLADFTAAEADYTGYASVVLTYSAIALDEDGGYVAVTNRAFFQATDAVSPNTIGGAWVETAGAGLIEYFPFAVPVPMTEALASMAALGFIRNPGPDQLYVTA